jgi:hypothetical protein
MEREARSPSDLFCDPCETEIRAEQDGRVIEKQTWWNESGIIHAPDSKGGAVHIARVYDDFQEFAPIIAAAPELLVACEAAEVILALFVYAGYDAGDGIEPVLTEARAAIAKAKGGW